MKKKLNGISFSVDEVIGYIEDKLINDEASHDQEIWYQTYKYEGKYIKNTTFYNTVKEMRYLFNYNN